MNNSNNRIRKSNFEFGLDKSNYHQTTQQFNSTLRNRCMSARKSVDPHQTLDRVKLNKTQFQLGFVQPSHELANSQNKISSQDYSNNGEKGSKHKIFAKGKGKNNDHNYKFGNTKVDYKSSNADSYRKIEMISNITKNKVKNSHESELTKQHKKRNHIINQNKNMLMMAK